ncbi:MAG: insulinase family protein [Chitinophagaceae bacterium]
MTIFKKCMLSLLLTGFFYVPALSQYGAADAIPLDPNVKVGKLPNGLTYYISKNVKPAKKVELRLAVNAGSVLENDNQRGLAHFMEHMGFNGTTHFPKNELVDFLQKSGVKFGADLNAYTSFDETVYILPVPTDDPAMFDKGLMVLEDWAFNNVFDKNEIEKERGVVLEESRLRKGAFERMSTLYYPRLFNGSKYAERLPIGKDDILKTFKPETLKSFYKNWYRPNQMAVMVVGDIDPAEAEKLIRAHFSKFTNPPAATARPAVIPITVRVKPEAMVLTDEEATNTFVQIYNFVKPAQKVKTWGDYRKGVIENLVSSLINQRLQQLTQKENPPFLFANAGFSPFIRGYSSFNSFAVLSKGTIQDAVNALITETNRARQFGFLQTELDRAKASLLNGTEKAYNEREKSESGQLIGQYVNSFLNGSPIPGISNRYNFIQQNLPAISLQEVNDVARSMPSTSNAFTLVQAPAAMKSQLPDSSQLLQALVNANSIPILAYEEKAVASILLDKAPVAGKITAETVNEKLGFTNLTLSNGVSISIKPTNLKNDEIKLDAWRLGGSHKYLLADKGNAENAAVLVNTMGVKDLSSSDLEKFMAGKTMDAGPYINPDEEGIEGSSSVKDFETFLQLIHLYFTQPRKDEVLFNSFISKQKGSLEFLSKNPQLSYQDTLNKIIYDNNPWMNAIPKVSDYDKISLDRSFAIYKEIFGNAWGMHFTFVGNIDVAKAKPLLEKYLGSLPATTKENTVTDIGARMIKGYTDITLKRGKEPKALINLMFEGETTYSRANRQQLAVLLEALNIEIIEKLREEMSGMYGGGMSGAVLKRPYAHYTIQASIPCGPENAEKLTQALLGIIKNAQEKGVAQKDLDKVKETIKKQYSANMQRNEYWLDNLSSAFINDDNPENILDYIQLIDSITVDDLKNIAKKYLTTDNMVKAVLYPESATVKEEVKTTKKGF